ncbi:uncharacterized protein LOC129599515 [Paramacrobiotus metropolitanus]|uniref:uncharacterized protein LOC129599515 n=1 Tax=Paramacrobiotus metropolitanus TaxID=2943436 RepID=UPI0024460A0C|nr:uncharacterized protein LOC129599515 [Paramacrobiotus metropolitanus]
MYNICLLIFTFGLLVTPWASGNRRNNRTNHKISAEDRALGSFLQKVAIGRAQACQTDADCSKRGNIKCLGDNMNFCGRPSVANIFQAADDKECSADADCQSLTGTKKLASRCVAGRCDFCGPRLCETDADCCSLAQGGGQKCATLSGYAEKRCWKTCTRKDDCLVSLGPARGKLVCVDGLCQKRNRKGKVA